jgi:acyl dehydratase
MGGTDPNTMYWDDYELGVRRVTGGRTITETDVVIHAGHTNDFSPYHTDAEWVKTQPFGQRIAHGTLTFAVGVGLGGLVVGDKAFSYGYDRIRFVKPVFIGDTIHAEVTITEKRDDPKHADRGFVHETGDIRNQRGETVLVFTHIHAVQKRPG